MSSYCKIAQGHPIHGPYHNKEYGFPATEEDILFERLLLEIFQAGLSWSTILNKREGFKIAFKQFQVDTVADFNDRDLERLLLDKSIIRNRKKIEAVIYNSKQIILMRNSHGDFAKWLETNHPMPRDEWIRLFGKTFKFTGNEIVNSFLISIGYLPGAHEENCPVFKEIIYQCPAWYNPRINEPENETT